MPALDAGIQGYGVQPVPRGQRLLQPRLVTLDSGSRAAFAALGRNDVKEDCRVSVLGAAPFLKRRVRENTP